MNTDWIPPVCIGLIVVACVIHCLCICWEYKIKDEDEPKPAETTDSDIKELLKTLKKIENQINELKNENKN